MVEGAWLAVCFAVSGPTLWNSLSLSLHDPSVTTDTDSVLCASEDCVILHSIWNTSI